MGEGAGGTGDTIEAPCLVWVQPCRRCPLESVLSPPPPPSLPVSLFVYACALVCQRPFTFACLFSFFFFCSLFLFLRAVGWCGDWLFNAVMQECPPPTLNPPFAQLG